MQFYMTDIAYLSRSLSHTQKYNMGKKCMKVGMCWMIFFITVTQITIKQLLLRIHADNVP